MTEILNFFNKIVEVYGSAAGIVFLVVLVIGVLVFFVVKNFSSIIKNYIEKKWVEKDDKHSKGAKHRKNISPKIRSELSYLAKEVGADRALVFEFSNGSSNLVGLPFLYMTATSEVVTPGTMPVAMKYNKLNTSIFAEFLEILESKGYFYVEDIEELKDDYKMVYNFMKPNGAKTALFYSLYGVDESIGFVVATTVGTKTFTRNDSLPTIASTAQRISSMLNFDTLYEEM